MTDPIEAGCLCGAVRLKIWAPVMIGGACYCTDCQAVSGGAPSYGLMFPAEAVEVTKGTLKTHTLTAESGNQVHREFCPECGVHVISHNSAAPQLRSVKVGALDDPSAFQSGGSLFVSSAQPWHQPDPDLPQHQTMPCLADLPEMENAS